MTQSLDEWFAAADDVLADWQGDSDDAMHYEPSKGERDLPAADSYYSQALLGRCDVREWAATAYERYAELVASIRWVAVPAELEAVRARLNDLSSVRIEIEARAAYPQRHLVGVYDESQRLDEAPRITVQTDVPWVTDSVWDWDADIVSPPVEPDPRRAALDARRNRNTGPSDRRGLDGRYRRGATA